MSRRMVDPIRELVPSILTTKPAILNGLPPTGKIRNTKRSILVTINRRWRPGLFRFGYNQTPPTRRSLCVSFLFIRSG